MHATLRHAAALLFMGVVAALAVGCTSVGAEPPAMSVRDVEYRDGDTILRGHLAVPAVTRDEKRPAVLVVHEWWGRSAHVDRSAEELARLGYVGLAVDMYGGGRSTTDPEEAGAWAKSVRGEPEVLHRRVRAALDLLRAMPEVDVDRLACIGYCFGGTVSLEAAWAGLPLRGVVAFHASLTTPRPEDAAGVKSSILVCHGADDALVSAEAISAFQSAMREHGYDWEFDSYGGAVHSFTNPAADGTRNASVRYHPVAAARAWARMSDFLAEKFR